MKESDPLTRSRSTEYQIYLAQAKKEEDIRLERRSTAARILAEFVDRNQWSIEDHVEVKEALGL